MELFKNTHLVKLELLSNATTIDSALDYIRSKQEQTASHNMPQEELTDNSNNDSDTQLTTTTGGRQTVF